MLGNFQSLHNKFLPGAGSYQKPGGAHRIGLRARKVFVFIRAAPWVSEPRPGRAFRIKCLQKGTFRVSGNEAPGASSRLAWAGAPPAKGGNKTPTGQAPPGWAGPPQAGQGHAPTDVAPTDVAPTDVAPADAAPMDVAPADAAPTDVAPTDVVK